MHHLFSCRGCNSPHIQSFSLLLEKIQIVFIGNFPQAGNAQAIRELFPCIVLYSIILPWLVTHTHCSTLPTLHSNMHLTPRTDLRFMFKSVLLFHKLKESVIACDHAFSCLNFCEFNNVTHLVRRFYHISRCDRSVSGQFLVFKPQSGFTQMLRFGKTSHGFAQQDNTISSVVGILGLCIS